MVTEEEYGLILDNAAKAGMTVSKYAGYACTGKEVIVIDEVRGFTHELHKIGTNLNQLVILAHQGRISCVELTPTLEAVKGIWRSLNLLTEGKKRRKPTEQ